MPTRGSVRPGVRVREQLDAAARVMDHDGALDDRLDREDVLVSSDEAKKVAG
jgi:hypothetical protein